MYLTLFCIYFCWLLLPFQDIAYAKKLASFIFKVPVIFVFTYLKISKYFHTGKLLKISETFEILSPLASSGCT